MSTFFSILKLSFLFVLITGQLGFAQIDPHANGQNSFPERIGCFEKILLLTPKDLIQVVNPKNYLLLGQNVSPNQTDDKNVEMFYQLYVNKVSDVTIFDQAEVYDNGSFEYDYNHRVQVEGKLILASGVTERFVFSIDHETDYPGAVLKTNFSEKKSKYKYALITGSDGQSPKLIRTLNSSIIDFPCR